MRTSSTGKNLDEVGPTLQKYTHNTKIRGSLINYLRSCACLIWCCLPASPKFAFCGRLAAPHVPSQALNSRALVPSRYTYKSRSAQVALHY